MTDLPLAVDRTYTTKEGDRRDEVTYVDVTVWDRQAENCCQYLKKGQPVHVEGSIRMDSWDDKTTGEKRTKLKGTGRPSAVPQQPTGRWRRPRGGLCPPAGP